MDTLIPVEYYTQVFYFFILVITLFTYSRSGVTPIDDQNNLKLKNTYGVILLFVVVIYTGIRPLSGKYFGDMRTYSDSFESYAKGTKVDTSPGKDYLFEFFMKGSSSIMSIDLFFLMCALLYIIPLYFTSKKIFEEYWYYCFLILIASFSFWSYGTNGIRNGIATSLFLLAIASKEKRLMLFWLVISFFFHKSILIPIVGLFLTLFHNNTKSYLLIWLLAIPLSLALGGFWENFFLNIGIFDDTRLEGYLGGDDEFQEQFSSLGFRWDFLLYSMTGVFAGWYFIIRKEFKDPLYKTLFNIYLFANAFWILVIRANFSNRFAYLSWFMLGIIIIYPLLKMKFFNNQHLVIGRILIIYFLFTFVLNVILAK